MFWRVYIGQLWKWTIGSQQDLICCMKEDNYKKFNFLINRKHFPLIYFKCVFKSEFSKEPCTNFKTEILNMAAFFCTASPYAKRRQTLRYSCAVGCGFIFIMYEESYVTKSRKLHVMLPLTLICIHIGVLILQAANWGCTVEATLQSVVSVQGRFEPPVTVIMLSHRVSGASRHLGFASESSLRSSRFLLDPNILSD